MSGGKSASTRPAAGVVTRAAGGGAGAARGIATEVVRGPGQRRAPAPVLPLHGERIICTVNQANRADVFDLLDIADELGVSLVKFHVFSAIGTGHGNSELAMTPPEWVDFCDHLNEIAKNYQTRVWYQPTYARHDQMARYQAEGYQGCIGRTLDRISIFPDGRCYVCSYLFDTDLHFAQMDGDRVRLNHGENEFDLFTKPLVSSSCGGCKAPACLGGCPAEEIVMGASSCETYADIVPVCRLWKSSAKPEE